MASAALTYKSREFYQDANIEYVRMWTSKPHSLYACTQCRHTDHPGFRSIRDFKQHGCRIHNMWPLGYRCYLCGILGRDMLYPNWQQAKEHIRKDHSKYMLNPEGRVVHEDMMFMVPRWTMKQTVVNAMTHLVSFPTLGV